MGCLNVMFLRFWPVLRFMCTQLSHGCALLEPGDLWDTITISSALEWQGINLFQFLFTLKRVLMKQMQIQQKEAFLLSTLTPVPKNIIFIEKGSRNKMQGEIFLTILKLFLWLRECFQLLALCHYSATQSFTLSMSSTCLFTNCGFLVSS